MPVTSSPIRRHPHPAVDNLGAAITSAAQCSQCHSDTVNTDGTIKVAGGLHVNGVIDGGGHGDYTAPAIHGPAFFDYLRGTGLDCKSCHGQDLNGGSAPFVQRLPRELRLDRQLADQLLLLPRHAQHLHPDEPLQREHVSDAVRAPRCPLPAAHRAPPTPAAPAPTRHTSPAGAARPAPSTRTPSRARPATRSRPTTPTQADPGERRSRSRARVRSRPASAHTPRPTPPARTYCHSPSVPVWTGGELGCGGCHGLPPPQEGTNCTRACDEGITCANAMPAR